MDFAKIAIELAKHFAVKDHSYKSASVLVTFVPSNATGSLIAIL